MPSVNEQVKKLADALVSEHVDKLVDEHVVQITLDVECKRILDQLESSKVNSFVNEAIKAAFNNSGGNATGTVTGQSSTNDTPTTPADLARAQLERIFGGDFAFIDCQNVEGNAQAVVLIEVKNKDSARCDLKDALDILKSLRQPITHQEVWEIIKAIAVA